MTASGSGASGQGDNDDGSSVTPSSSLSLPFSSAPNPLSLSHSAGQWTAVMMVVGPAACEEVRFGDGDGNSVAS